MFPKLNSLKCFKCFKYIVITEQYDLFDIWRFWKPPNNCDSFIIIFYSPLQTNIKRWVFKPDKGLMINPWFKISWITF